MSQTNGNFCTGQVLKKMPDSMKLTRTSLTCNFELSPAANDGADPTNSGCTLVVTFIRLS